MSKVVSVRMSEQTLADVYNFLSIACEISVTNLPVSRAVNMSLDNMMRWVRHSIDLPTYNTPKEALDVVESYINRVPGTFNNTVLVTEMDLGEIEEKTLDHLIGQNLSDNSERKEEEVPEGPPILTQSDIDNDKEQKDSKKANLVTLIDEFRDKIEEDERTDLLSKITTPLYKE